jgi:hypothetical protein
MIVHRAMTALPLIGLLAVTACGAQAQGDSAQEGDIAEVTSPLVGSFELPNGGKLDIYEVAAGDFVIGERIPANGVQATPDFGETDDAESLTTLYRRFAGTDAVPDAVVSAEARRLQHLADIIPARAARAELPVQIPHALETGGEYQAKEAPRDVAGFRLYYCRETPGAVKNFTFCWPERTGDATVSKVNAHGSYSALRAYRGSVNYSLRYNITGWETAFNVVVYEGEGYHARRVGPVRDYDVEARVRNADGDGFNLALIGTTNRADKGCYSSYDSIACVVIAP